MTVSRDLKQGGDLNRRFVLSEELFFAETSYARNRLILKLNGGTVIDHAILDFIGISVRESRREPAAMVFSAHRPEGT
jgi:hypothetical protein